MTSTVSPLVCPPGYRGLPPLAAPYIADVEAAVARWAPAVAPTDTIAVIDVYTVFAVMSRESGFGRYLVPSGPAGTGDGGHGLGLMQLDDRYHPGDLKDPEGRANADWVRLTRGDGVPLWQLPAENIGRGVWQLATTLKLLGNLPAAICAYNAGVVRAREVLDTVAGSVTSVDGLVHALDQWTTGRDYVADVLRRRSEFLSPKGA
mgnify:FL=1